MGNGGCKYICNFTRLFYCAIADFEVTDGSRVSFPTDSPNHLPDLFHGSLTTHSRDIGSPAISMGSPTRSEETDPGKATISMGSPTRSEWRSKTGGRC